MHVYPLSSSEERVIRWLLRLLSTAAAGLVAILGLVSAAI